MEDTGDDEGELLSRGSVSSSSSSGASDSEVSISSAPSESGLTSELSTSSLLHPPASPVDGLRRLSLEAGAASPAPARPSSRPPRSFPAWLLHLLLRRDWISRRLAGVEHWVLRSESRRERIVGIVSRGQRRPDRSIRLLRRVVDTPEKRTNLLRHVNYLLCDQPAVADVVDLVQRLLTDEVRRTRQMAMSGRLLDNRDVVPHLVQLVLLLLGDSTSRVAVIRLVRTLLAVPGIPPHLVSAQKVVLSKASSRDNSAGLIMQLLEQPQGPHLILEFARDLLDDPGLQQNLTLLIRTILSNREVTGMMPQMGKLFMQTPARRKLLINVAEEAGRVSRSPEVMSQFVAVLLGEEETRQLVANFVVRTRNAKKEALRVEFFTPAEPSGSATSLAASQQVLKELQGKAALHEDCYHTHGVKYARLLGRQAMQLLPGAARRAKRRQARAEKKGTPPPEPKTPLDALLAAFVVSKESRAALAKTGVLVAKRTVRGIPATPSATPPKSFVKRLSSRFLGGRVDAAAAAAAAGAELAAPILPEDRTSQAHFVTTEATGGSVKQKK